MISDSEPEIERIDDVGDRRDRNRERNVWAGRILGGVWARNLLVSLEDLLHGVGHGRHTGEHPLRHKVLDLVLLSHTWNEHLFHEYIVHVPIKHHLG
jgi:hypothetical protein